MVVDTAPVSKATDLPTAGDEMVYSSLPPWPVRRVSHQRSFLAAARALVRLPLYRYAGCTSSCSEPSGLRYRPSPAYEQNNERIFAFGDRSDHVATGSPQTSRKSLVLCDGLFGKNGHAARYACAEPKNAGRLLSCRIHAERRPVDRAGGHRKGSHIVDVLKLIDDTAKLAFALGKRKALDQHRRTNSCSYPEILLEFRTGPDRNVRNTRFGCRRATVAEASAAREPG